ncbi:MAG TPA: reverse transcriptase-like protein [Planococcus sp. (in: firmicutes)]|nr:reverse transcriptase-like protein [Planococcus sp. (in: firmicutes)]
MRIRIEWTYQTPKGTNVLFYSEELPAAQAVLIAEDLERTGRTSKMVLVDAFDSSWTIKELKGYLKSLETEPHNITVYFDGGFDRETGKAGLGCAIYYEQSGKSYRLRRSVAASELGSNNEAEYAALHLGLQELELKDVHDLPIRFIGDSKVVVNGMKGDWPVIERDLARWADRIEQKMQKLGILPEYELVPRKANAEADRLATQALQGVEITGAIELVE